MEQKGEGNKWNPIIRLRTRSLIFEANGNWTEPQISSAKFNSKCHAHLAIDCRVGPEEKIFKQNSLPSLTRKDADSVEQVLADGGDVRQRCVDFASRHVNRDLQIVEIFDARWLFFKKKELLPIDDSQFLVHSSHQESVV